MTSKSNRYPATVSVRLTEKMEEWLESMAETAQCSVAVLIRTILLKHMATDLDVPCDNGSFTEIGKGGGNDVR